MAKKQSNTPAARPQVATSLSAKTLQAIAQPVAMPSTIPGMTTKRQLTMPVLKMLLNYWYLLRITAAMQMSTFKKEGDEKAATICPVVDITTGEMKTFLVSAVVQKNIEEQYPDGDYVGKVFLLMKTPKRPGKRYYDFNISEVDFTDETLAWIAEQNKIALGNKSAAMPSDPE